MQTDDEFDDAMLELRLLGTLCLLRFEQARMPALAMLDHFDAVGHTSVYDSLDGMLTREAVEHSGVIPRHTKVFRPCP